MNPFRPGSNPVFLAVVLVALFLAMRAFLLEPTLIIAVHQGVEGGPMKRVAKLFCNTYRGKVEIVELDYDQLFEAEWSAVTGKPAKFPFSDPPRFDVIMLDDPWLPAFVGTGGQNSRILPLDADRLAGSPVASRPGMADFPQPCREVCQRDGKYYAVPFTGNSQLFCRAKDRGHPPAHPAGWNDVASMQASLDKPSLDKLGYAMRLRPGNSVVTDFLPMLWAYAPDSFKADYTTIDPRQAVQGFRMFHKLAEPQHWASAVTQDVDVAVSLALGSAQSGIVWNAWAMALERLKGPNAPAGFEFSRFQDPNLQPLLGAWLLAVPANAEHPRQSTEFIKFVIEGPQLELGARFGNPPPRISVLQNHLESPYPAILDSLSHARPRPRTPCWREVEQTLSNALSNWREDQSDRVLATLQSDLQAIHDREKSAGCPTQ